MDKRRLLKYLVPLGIPILIAIFIYNVYEHGIVISPGEALFKAHCAECHGDKGEGIKVLVPPMSDKNFLVKSLDSIPCWMKNGIFHPVTINGILYDQPMYPNGLDEIQTANIINYLNSEFVGSDKEVNAAWVKKKWEECK